ncbi:hypothetical protein R3X28_15050 [Maribacter sp. TH_r10]|nr:hypothetical protein [Maribacter sp. TH_r10]MDV7140208.1 hypothetical protein [Maribacter sp. TH_r10]
MSKPAAVLLFAYKRLNALKNTVAALQKNTLTSESDVFVFSDGALQKDEQ